MQRADTAHAVRERSELVTTKRSGSSDRPLARMPASCKHGAALATSSTSMSPTPRCSHAFDVGIAIPATGIGQKAATRAQAPMRTARAIPIVRHGARRTGPARSPRRRSGRARHAGGRGEAIVRPTAGGHMRLGRQPQRGSCRVRAERPPSRRPVAGLLTATGANVGKHLVASGQRGCFGSGSGRGACDVGKTVGCRHP